jgi:hypothetical protein
LNDERDAYNDSFCPHVTTMVTSTLVVKALLKEPLRRFRTGQAFPLFQDVMKTGEAHGFSVTFFTSSPPSTAEYIFTLF